MGCLSNSDFILFFAMGYFDCPLTQKNRNLGGSPK
jgi:hypothetical protein